MKEQDYKYMVSTRCFTFNHAPYIEDALRGFVMQETTFPVVFLVIDDASTDGEQDILRRWADANLTVEECNSLWRRMPFGELAEGYLRGKPNTSFAILLLSENHYRQKKSKLPYLAEWLQVSKYHALCEGDDYWTDPSKLHKQVVFMETHPDYSLCHTAFSFLYQSDGRLEQSCPYSDRISDLEKETSFFVPYILNGNYYRIQTCSALYRRSDYEKICPEFEKMSGKFLMGDTPLWCLLNSVGKVHYLKEYTCVYRINEGSASRPNEVEKKRRFQLSSAEMRVYMSDLFSLDDVFKDRFRKELLASLLRYLPYNKDYVPIVSLQESGIEKLRISILKTRFFCELAKRKDIIVQSQFITTLKRKRKNLPDRLFAVTFPFVSSLPFRRLRTYYLRLFIGRLGHGVYVGRWLKINRPSRIFIGDDVVINDNVRLDGRRYLYIGNHVDIATEATIWTLHHDYNDAQHKAVGGVVSISDYCWICYRSVVLPNTQIGRGAVVAACAVVTKDVEAMKVVGGIPAKEIAVRQNALKYILNP